MEYPSISDVSVMFHSPGHDSCPYVGSLKSYDLSGGFLEFDGYFYVDEGEIAANPKKFFLQMHECEDTPWKVEEGTSFYKYKWQFFKEVEVYRIEKGEDTSRYSKVQDDNEGEMNICFFPTCQMKLWFRVVKDILEENA